MVGKYNEEVSHHVSSGEQASHVLRAGPTWTLVDATRVTSFDLTRRSSSISQLFFGKPANYGFF